MRRKIVILLVSAATLLASCGPSGERKPGRRMIIPDDKVVEILTDTYLAAGMLDVPVIRMTWGQRDSILNYVDVIEDHGYTYEQLETTIKYYFANKPKRLAKIYDRVVGNLLELEVKVQNTGPRTDSIPDDNLWTGRSAYSLPEDFARDPIWFDIPVDTAGEYVLRADFLVFEDDGSLDPRVTVFFSTKDSLGTEQRVDWEEAILEKSGKLQPIEIRMTLDSAAMTHIKGWLMNHNGREGKWQKHARISNISLKLEKQAMEKK